MKVGSGSEQTVGKMAMNTKMFSETSGRMRLASIIFAIVAFVLLVDNYGKNISNEEAYFYALMICMIISVIMAVVSFLGLLENSNLRMLDNVFHAVAALAIIITSILFLVSVFEYRKYHTNSLFAKRLSSGILGFIYGLMCANMGWLLFRS